MYILFVPIMLLVRPILKIPAPLENTWLNVPPSRKFPSVDMLDVSDEAPNKL